MAIPCGERSGRVASSDSRLYIRMEDWPPMRRCLLVPWEASSWVMKETWSAFRAVVAFLDGIVSILGLFFIKNEGIGLCFV